jgi:hypothetical protein
MNSPPIASDLSYEVAQLRRLRGECGPQTFDTSHRLFNVPSLIANRRRFIADVDQVGGDAPRSNPLSVALGAVDSE